jgi:hypothetical protein
MTSSSKWVAMASALGLVACSPTVKSDVKEVQVRTAGLHAHAGVEMTASVSCESGYEVAGVPLAPSQGDAGVFEGVLEGVPAGVSCDFAAQGVEHREDLGEDLHYSASITRRFARDERSPLLVLVLQQEDWVTTFGNAVPRVLGLTASSASVDMLGPFLADLRTLVDVNADSIVLLNAGLYDPDGDPLFYRWDDAGLDGTFLDLDAATMQYSLWSNYNEGLWRTVEGPIPSTIWVPPLGMTGTAHLTITVKDEHTGSGPGAQTVHSMSSLSVAVDVSDANGVVPVNFEGGSDNWPEVLDMQVALDPNSTGGKIFPGEAAQIQATVRDVDLDPLNYIFVSACPGAFFDALGNRLSDPLSIPKPAPPLAEDGTASLLAYFIPAVAPSTGTCDLILYVDDGLRGGRVREVRQIEVVPDNPVALGPDITLARATPETIGKDSEVQLEVAAQSRNGNPDLVYQVDILSWLPIPTDYLPSPDFFGTFVGEKQNDTGQFTWRSAADETACIQANSLNSGSTFYFLVSVSDASDVSTGSPATNRVVIPVHVDCAH